MYIFFTLNSQRTCKLLKQSLKYPKRFSFELAYALGLAKKKKTIMTKTIRKITNYWNVFIPLSYRSLADTEKPFGVLLILNNFKNYKHKRQAHMPLTAKYG